MKHLSVIPEMIIWLAFLIITGFGYAFSFLEFLNEQGSYSIFNIIFPTFTWFLLAVVSTFLLKTVKNTKHFIQFSKSERLFLETSIVLILLVGGWIFRFVEAFRIPEMTSDTNIYFEFAQISVNGERYMSPHPISRIYVGFLHFVCKFLGNIYEMGTIVQYILLMISVLIWYFAIRKAFGMVPALFFVAGAMLLPDSIRASMECNPMMILFLVYGVIAYLTVNYACSCGKENMIYLQIFCICFLTGLACLFDISGVLMLVLFLAAGFYRESCGKDQNVNKRSDLFTVLGILSGGICFHVVQMALYDTSYFKAGSFNCYRNLKAVMPTIDSIKEFAFELGNHPIFAVAIIIISVFWFMKDRNPFSWTMAAILYLFLVKFFKLDTYLQHDFLIYMAIIFLLGIAVNQFLTFDYGKHRGMPVETTLHFEEEPAVTVEEHPVIYIPKTMEVPKRVSKPKVDYAIDVKEDALHFDVVVKENEDFDIH